MVYITEPRRRSCITEWFRFPSESILCLSPTLSFLCFFWSRVSLCLYFFVSIKTSSFKEEIDSLAINLYSLKKKTMWASQNGTFFCFYICRQGLAESPKWALNHWVQVTLVLESPRYLRLQGHATTPGSHGALLEALLLRMLEEKPLYSLLSPF